MSDASVPHASSSEPVVPGQAAAAQPANPLAPSRGHAFAWSRFLARQIDLALFGMLFWGIVTAAFPAMQVPGNMMVSTFVTLPVALLIEVPVMALFGWTLGKLIFGVSVRRADGARLSAAEVFRRNTVLWVRGLGAGLPVLNAIFQGWCYRDAKNGKPSKWDATAAHTVRQPAIAGWRWALGLAVFLGIFAVMMAPTVRALLHRPAKQVAVAPPSPAFVWSNPQTGGTATIPAGWSAAPDRAKDPSTHEFDHGDSFVLLTEDVITGAKLDDFVGAVRDTGKYGSPQGQRVETQANGRRMFILNYRDTDEGQTFHVVVRVWETEPGNFWRTISFTPIGDEAEAAATAAVAKALGNTSVGPKAAGAQKAAP